MKASLALTWAFASCHFQFVVASMAGVTTRFDGELVPFEGRLSSIAIGFKVSQGVKKKMVRVA